MERNYVTLSIFYELVLFYEKIGRCLFCARSPFFSEEWQPLCIYCLLLIKYFSKISNCLHVIRAIRSSISTIIWHKSEGRPKALLKLSNKTDIFHLKEHLASSASDWVHYSSSCFLASSVVSSNKTHTIIFYLIKLVKNNCQILS